MSNENLPTKNMNLMTAVPICQHVHQDSYLKKDTSTNHWTPPGPYTKRGQPPYPSHPQLTAQHKAASATSPEKTTIALPVIMHASSVKYQSFANKWHCFSHNNNNRPNPTPDSTSKLSNNELNQVFIAQATAAVAQIRKETIQPPTKMNKQSATNITKSPELGTLMDESFVSPIMKSCVDSNTMRSTSSMIPPEPHHDPIHQTHFKTNMATHNQTTSWEC